MYEDVKEYLNWYDTRKDMAFERDAPIIGLVLQRSHLVTGDEGHYSGVVSEMEARGAKVRRLRVAAAGGQLVAAVMTAATWRMQVVPVFAGGLDFSLPVRKYFYDPLGSGKAFVDCVVSLTGFALVGGPARQDAPKVPFRVPWRAVHMAACTPTCSTTCQCDPWSAALTDCAGGGGAEEAERAVPGIAAAGVPDHGGVARV